MSRRWYRYGRRMIFLGWEPSLQRFFLAIADLCRHCGGFGEEPDSDDFCGACGGEGVEQAFDNPGCRMPAATLDEIAAELAALEIPFPDMVRADLELDQRTNASTVVHGYE